MKKTILLILITFFANSLVSMDQQPAQQPQQPAQQQQPQQQHVLNIAPPLAAAAPHAAQNQSFRDRLNSCIRNRDNRELCAVSAGLLCFMGLVGFLFSLPALGLA